MRFSKKLLSSAIALSVVSAAAVTPLANAEVSGSVGVASTYLWRGSDLGSGTPAVSGDLNYSTGGFYTGIWGSSGDTYAGTEYDLYVGYGTSFGEDDMFSVDASLWNYNYPTGLGYLDDPETDVVEQETDFFDLADFVLSLGLGPVALTSYIPVGEGSSGDYMYLTLGGSVGDFSLTLGLHSENAAVGGAVGCPAGTVDTCSPVHINLDYAYNDNLTFTFSQFVADEPENDNLKFVVSYSLPIGE